MANFSNIRKLDLTTFAGLAIAVGSVVGGLLLEKGTIQDLAQVTALLIVFGGTIGAVMLSTPASSLMRALRRSRTVFLTEESDDAAVAETILKFAAQARRSGIALMETQARQVEDPFLRKGLMLAVDGVDTKEIRRHLELELRLAEESVDADARVFELAGGYAPTVGIMGAVLGLIQVMKHLNNVSEVGHGIAVAFVATIYGVGSANLLLLPAAAKIRRRAQVEAQRRELMLEGILGIAEGLNSHLIRLKLEGFLEPQPDLPAPAKPAPNASMARDTL
jgi:chemotaxis protein MotA